MFFVFVQHDCTEARRVQAGKWGVCCAFAGRLCTTRGIVAHSCQTNGFVVYERRFCARQEGREFAIDAAGAADEGHEGGELGEGGGVFRQGIELGIGFPDAGRGEGRLV
jgi:hypothetical protein